MAFKCCSDHHYYSKILYWGLDVHHTFYLLYSFYASYNYCENGPNGSIIEGQRPA